MNQASLVTLWARRLQIAAFYLANRHRFKRLELRALVTKPLRIEGSHYISIGRQVRIRDYAWLSALKIDAHDPELIFSEGCSLGDFNHIVAVRRVELGRQVLTANGVYISDNVHGFEDVETAVLLQPVRFKAEVHIGDGSWLGEHVCVIGANIGRHCVIGANAVVTRDIPDYAVAAGAPARIIRQFNLQTRQWEPVDSGEK